ncbi:hypothetical protein D3X11_02730 [Streptococcus sp. X16XC17]|uniref:hypothetical protein n=1 Tax=unclassified Streptococcus TaxID=2608887 RepID=UPI00066FF0DE|nr:MULTISPECIES: hypothetical protein [unclassified Streptococcus]TCD46358.1 hypothetical protein D3X11_02730 [Streptococcus sp. X16XC17]
MRDSELHTPTPPQYAKEETVQLTPEASTSLDGNGTDLSFYRTLTLAVKIKDIHVNTALGVGGGYNYDIQLDKLLVPHVEAKKL